MFWYFLKMLLLLPLLALMIWGSLRLTKWMQGRMNDPARPRSARLIETTILSPGVRLAVIEFHGRHILVGASRHGLTRLAEAPASESAPALANKNGAFEKVLSEADENA